MQHLTRIVSVLALSFTTTTAFAGPATNGCKDLPSHEALREALIASRKMANGGLNLDMWGAMVDRSGVVCAVAFTGKDFGDQWPGSRLIAAEKANTANAFSLPGLALSTANLYFPVQPGGSLFGLANSHPVDTSVAGRGESSAFGTVKDPMIGDRIGGIIVFGGGLALYSKDGRIVGALGVSGDTSCADHHIAWRARAALELDYVPAGVAKDKTDQIIYDIKGGKSAGGFGQPTCGKEDQKIADSLPKVRKVAK